jgi:cysteinyl-tRNA synthetase
VIEKARNDLITAMDDNFNSADALAAIFDYLRAVNELIRTNEIAGENAQTLLALFDEFGEIFGVSFVEKAEDELTPELKQLIADREEARSSKNWKLADEIRDKLKAQGIVLEDGNTGTVWKRIK